MGVVSASYLSLTLSPTSTLSEVSILSGCDATLNRTLGLIFPFASLFEEVLLFFQAAFKAVVILAKSGHTENFVLLLDMHRDVVVCQ